MSRRINKNNLIILLGFCCLLLLIALLICGAALLSLSHRLSQKEAEPARTVDAQLLMDNAALYNVSTEYLQLLLPDYLVYRDGLEYVFAPLEQKLSRHEYDWSQLTYDFGRIHYQGAGEISYGVDVSTYQQKIDWHAVAGDDIDFAMVRLGYRGYSVGKLEQDEYAVANLDGAAAAGLDVGAYFFSQAITPEEAEEEARLVLQILDGRELRYPVVFDMEEIDNDQARTDTLSIAQRTEIALAFCKEIKKAGYQPMIYGNIKWLAGRIDLTRLKDYPLWLAQYYEKPLFPYMFQMWQYTDSGSVAGISTSVDLNICFQPFGK